MPRPLRLLGSQARHACLGLACLGLAAVAHAHGDEPHDDTAAHPTVSTESAPRTQAQTDAFELVAVLTPAGASPAQLMLYLDRFDTNAPVTHATVEVESGPFKATAKAIEPGVYAAPGQAFVEAGRHPLTISVQAGDDADLLEATLVTPSELVASTHSPDSPLFGLHGINRWGALVGLFALTWTGIVLWRRMRRSPL